MNERVIPTEPGWWWASFCGQEPECVYVFFGGGGDLIVDRDGTAAFDVVSTAFTWVEPVAPIGDLAAAESELDALKQRIAAAPVVRLFRDDLLGQVSMRGKDSQKFRLLEEDGE